MKYTNVTKQAELEGALDGVAVRTEFVNNVLSRVELRDAKGGVLVFERTNTYEPVKVLRPAAPKLVDRYRLHGKWKGLDVCEVFKDEHAAERRREEIEGYNETPTLTVEKVKVDEDTAAPAADDVISF